MGLANIARHVNDTHPRYFIDVAYRDVASNGTSRLARHVIGHRHPL
jgi:hypothetical protein